MKNAIRQLVKNPGFTIVALATLALGIGINTTTFTVLNRLLLQRLPFREPDRMVQIWASYAQYGFGGQAPGDYFDEKKHNTVFEDMVAYVPGIQCSLAEPGKAPERFGATGVDVNFFSLFGIRPQLGRVFTEEEAARFEPVTIITNSFWHEHYNADPAILGKTAKINSKVYTIVGVLPPSMDEPTLFGGKIAFFNLDFTGMNPDMRNLTWYTVAARLKPGVTIEQAQAEMKTLAASMAKDHPATNEGRSLNVVPYPSSIVDGSNNQLAWLVMALSGMVLLIACANLANLQLVRTMRRTQEIGVRFALGCSRGMLIRLLLAESIILSVAGGLIGLLAAKWSNAYVASFFGFDMPLNFRVLGFTFVVSLFTGGIFGIVPAWIASRTDITVSLKTSGRGSTSDRSRHWLRQSLVVAQLALALILLSGAGFFVTGIYQLTHQQLGWSQDHLLTGFIELDHDHYGEQRDPRSLVFSDQMGRALEALPGVEGVEFGDTPAYGFNRAPVVVDGQPMPVKGKEIFASIGRGSPEFFKVYGIRLLQGRNFRDTDRLGAPAVAIVNESLANKFWPGESPLGKKLAGTDPSNPGTIEVVGVMQDFKCAAEFYDPTQNSLKYMTPWAQNNHRWIMFSVRTAGEPAALKDSIRKAVGLLAPDIALSAFATVKDVVASTVAYFSFLRRVLIQISATGLLLAVIGIYGVVANLASERTKEIGIRMALGAEPRSIVWLFLRNGMMLAVIGAAIGAAASFFLVKMLKQMLPAIPGLNPWAIAVVSVLFVMIAVIASWLPARRTTRINPVVALQSE